MIKRGHAVASMVLEVNIVRYLFALTIALKVHVTYHQMEMRCASVGQGSPEIAANTIFAITTVSTVDTVPSRIMNAVANVQAHFMVIAAKKWT